MDKRVDIEVRCIKCERAEFSDDVEYDFDRGKNYKMASIYNGRDDKKMCLIINNKGSGAPFCLNDDREGETFPFSKYFMYLEDVRHEKIDKLLGE